MHVLIVDDEPLAREELHYLVSQHEQVTSIAEADSVETAIQQIMDQKPQLLFLDIHLTDESGFDLAEKLLQLAKPPYLIFATAYDEYALKAFEVNAGDYLLKPFEEERVLKAIDRALEKTQPEPSVSPSVQNTIEPLPIPGEDRIFLLDPHEIYLVSVEERLVSVFTKDETFTMTGTLNGIEHKLPAELFFKTHRSYILNLTKIREIQPWFNNTLLVTLTNDEKVPVSRSYVKKFKAQLGLNSL